MRLPRFTVSQLLLAATFFALVLGLFTSAWRAASVQAIQHVCFSPSCKFFAASYSDGMVRVWRMDGNRARLVLRAFAGERDPFYERSYIHFEDDNRLIRLDKPWHHTHVAREFVIDLAAGKVSDPRLLSRSEIRERGLAAPWEFKVSTDRSKVAERDAMGTLHVWDATSRQVSFEFVGERNEPFALSGDGSLVATIGLASLETPTVVILDGHSGALLEYPPFSDATSACWMEFAHDGSLLALGGSRGVECYDMKLKVLVQKIPLPESRPDAAWHARQDRSRYLALATDAKTLVSSDGEAIRFWDLRTGKLTQRIGRDSPATLIAIFVLGFTAWAATWGVVSKRLRLHENVTNGSSVCAPLEMKLLWGLMVAGGMVALAIPIVTMFLVGPLLFPTVYFGLPVGIIAIARGAARDTLKLRRTMVLQLANIVAFDPVNVVFSAMEYPLFRSSRASDYLRAANCSEP